MLSGPCLSHLWWELVVGSTGEDLQGMKLWLRNCCGGWKTGLPVSAGGEWRALAATLHVSGGLIQSTPREVLEAKKTKLDTEGSQWVCFWMGATHISRFWIRAREVGGVPAPKKFFTTFSAGRR